MTRFVILALAAVLTCSTATAMVVEFPGNPASVDSAGIDTAIDYLIAPYANAAEAPELLLKLKSMSAALGPIFLNELLKYLEDQTYWESPVDRKDDLLMFIPLIADNPRFEGFSDSPLRGEIEATLSRLKRFSVARGADGAARDSLFGRIFRALGYTGSPKPKAASQPSNVNVVTLEEARRARCEAGLIKPK